jgi:hypothetical protein
MNEMKLLMEGWRRYTTGRPIVSEGLMSLFGRVKSKIQRELRSGRITPYADGEGKWIEITVPYFDADVENVSEDVLLFVAIVDKLAEEMGVNEPAITSGYRDPRGQAEAMYGVWLDASESGDMGYLEKLYGEMCKSCEPGSGEIATEINNIFSTTVDRNEAIDAAAGLLSNNLISKHNTTPGSAVDYRIRGQIDALRVIDTAFERGYALGESIPEEHPPHYHVTVDSVTPAGIEYLETPNYQLDTGFDTGAMA